MASSGCVSPAFIDNGSGLDRAFFFYEGNGPGSDVLVFDGEILRNGSTTFTLANLSAVQFSGSPNNETITTNEAAANDSLSGGAGSGNDVFTVDCFSTTLSFHGGADDDTTVTRNAASAPRQAAGPAFADDVFFGDSGNVVMTVDDASEVLDHRYLFAGAGGSGNIASYRLSIGESFGNPSTFRLSADTGDDSLLAAAVISQYDGPSNCNHLGNDGLRFDASVTSSFVNITPQIVFDETPKQVNFDLPRSVSQQTLLLESCVDGFLDVEVSLQRSGRLLLLDTDDDDAVGAVLPDTSPLIGAPTRISIARRTSPISDDSEPASAPVAAGRVPTSTTTGSSTWPTSVCFARTLALPYRRSSPTNLSVERPVCRLRRDFVVVR